MKKRWYILIFLGCFGILFFMNSHSISQSSATVLVPDFSAKIMYLEEGEVNLIDRIYTVSDIAYIPSNCHIKGIYGKTVIRAGGDQTALMMTQPMSENITIENIIFDGNKDEQSGPRTIFCGHKTKNLVIKNCTFKNLDGWHLMELNAAQNVRIENCVFENYSGGTEMLQIDFLGSLIQFPWDNIFDDSVCEDISIIGCTFYGSGSGYGIGNHSFKKGVLSKNITIKNNAFHDLQGAVNLGDVQGGSIIGNISNGCEFPTYRVRSQENKSTGIIMEANK